MNKKPLDMANDEDARHAETALQRAALKARHIALHTQTPLVVMRDGQMLVENPPIQDKDTV